MNNTTVNLLTAPGRDIRPVVDRDRHIASLERSIQALRAAGLPTKFYENALEALKGAQQ